MKTKMTRIFALALALVLVVCAASGCGLVSVNEEADLAQVVAVVGGEEVLKGEYVQLFDSTAAMYTSWGVKVSDLNRENREELQDLVLNSLLRTKVANYMSKQAKVDTLTEEDKEKLAKQVEDRKATLLSYYVDYAKQAAWQDPSIDVNAYAEQMLLAAAQSAGSTATTLDMYWNQLEEEMKVDYLYDKARDHFCGDVKATEEEIKAWYDEHLQTDTEEYTENPGDYRTNQELTERYEGQEPVLYVPEGYIRVKEILIEPETTIDQSYYEMLTQMAELQNEIGVLTLADEAGNAERIAEIKAQYNDLKKQTDDMYQQHTQASREKASQLWRLLNSGADFDTVMKENTQDTYFLSNPIIMEKGRLMSHYDSGVMDWEDAIKEQVLALEKIGDYTRVIVTDSGSYIFQYASDEKAGPRPLAEVHDAIQVVVQEDKIDAAWEAKIDEWIADPELVTTYPNVIRDVGTR